MTLSEFLDAVVARFERCSIAHVVGGSIASSVEGETRTASGVDIAVEVNAASLRRLFEAFEPSSVYVDRPPDGLVGPGQMFNVIDLMGGWKIDLVVRRDRPFSEAEFARCR